MHQLFPLLLQPAKGGHDVDLKQKAPWFPKRLFALKNLGGVLLSHVVPHAVPSALKSLTSVFGMGTGVTSSL